MLEIIQDRTIPLFLCMLCDNRPVSTKSGDDKCYILGDDRLKQSLFDLRSVGSYS